ncbi:hypothetical protein [Limnobacter sp.]|uniref:hypothetical protein n=1 Tax=Limnobacter sp. TaxID=2003368 RepID=UPI002FE36A6D
MKWLGRFVCMGVCFTGLLGQAVAHTGSVVMPPLSGGAPPSTLETPGVPAKAVSRSTDQSALSGLLAANKAGNAEGSSTDAANLVFLKFQHIQGNPVYLIDDRRREGFVFFSVPVQEFQRITQIELPAGLEHLLDGGIRVVTALESKNISSNSTNRESNE